MGRPVSLRQRENGMSTHSAANGCSFVREDVHSSRPPDYRRVVEHFRLDQVADDAWAAVSVPDTGSVANAGIVRSGDTTIVFDTFVTPQAARDLRAEAEAIAPIARVVNSHWHDDHV